MRLRLLVIVALIGLLGIGIVIGASVGDASVMAGTAGIYSVLEAHGLGDNVALRNDLYAVVLGLKKPWALVQWMGLAVLALAVAGFVIVRRNLRD